jgi:hypothetical protein
MSTVVGAMRHVNKNFPLEKLFLIKLPYGIDVYSDLNGAALEGQQPGPPGNAAVRRR